MSDSFLEQLLEESVNGRIASRLELPSESALNAVHAQLARGSREARLFRLVEAARDAQEGCDDGR